MSRRPLPALLLAASLVVGACAPAEPPTAKVAVICVDGATFTVIGPLLAEGRLPHMAELIRRGARAVLESSPESDASPVIWNSIVTGVGMDAHGIKSFTKPGGRPGEHRIYQSSDRRVPALWQMAAERGATTGAIGLWNTWPAEEVPGYIVSDRFALSLFTRNFAAGAAPRLTHPDALLDELVPLIHAPDDITRADLAPLGTFSEAEWNELMTADKRSAGVVGGNGLVALKYGFQAQQTMGEVSVHLLGTRPQPDLFMTFLELPDRAGHHFWHAYRPGAVPPERGRVEPEWIERWGGVVPGAYEDVDRWIGEIMAELEPETTVFVISDHGMQSSEKPGGRIDDLSTMSHSGTHRSDGILIAAGPAIAPGSTVDDADVFDIANTVLVAMGLPPSTQPRGRVLDELLSPEFLERYPLQPARDEPPLPPREPLVVEDSEAQRKQLESIGYIDETGETKRFDRGDGGR